MAIENGGAEAITIDDIIIDPPLIPEYGTARLTVLARSARGWPLEFSIAVSDGWIEPTDSPNVFYWHGPKSPRRARHLSRPRPVFGGVH